MIGIGVGDTPVVEIESDRTVDLFAVLDLDSLKREEFFERTGNLGTCRSVLSLKRKNDLKDHGWRNNRG